MTDKLAMLIGKVITSMTVELFKRVAEGEELKGVLTLEDLVETKVLSELIREHEEEKAKKELE